MKRSKFSEHQIIAILKAVEAGRTVKDVCREHEVSDATYYKWKTKYGGMEAADIRRLRELEDENRRLKQMSAELLPVRVSPPALQLFCDHTGGGAATRA